MLRTVVVLLALLARPALAYPALWVLHGPHATVYLFGSFHALPPGAEWESPAIEHALDESAELWCELEGSPADQIVAASGLFFGAVDPSHTVTSRLSPPAAERFRATFGNAAGRIDHLRPWVVIMLIQAAQSNASGFTGGGGVEATLEREARAAGKPVHGIETVKSQIDAIASISDDEAMRSIEKALTEPKAESQAQLLRLEQVWLAGDLDALTAQLTDLMRDTSPELLRRLITDRNRVFADKIQALLQGDRTVLVTVGAAHLVGETGIPTLLRQRGLTVERVE